jgi:hypothetical protein
MIVAPSTADGFRAAVSAVRSVLGKKAVSFHKFTFPEDRCGRRLVKKRRLCTPESVVIGELESLNISSGSHKATIYRSRSGLRQGTPSHRHFIVSVAGGLELSKVRSLTELCGFRLSVEY